MSKKLDPDFKGLKGCVRAMNYVTPRMRKATLEFLWGKFIVHPKLEELQPTVRAKRPAQQRKGESCAYCVDVNTPFTLGFGPTVNYCSHCGRSLSPVA